nr:unnamed protein product [Callosobruchus chinensis]
MRILSNNIFELRSDILHDFTNTGLLIFRENKRFGPGVFTYENGQQDVGLWEGFSLVRLSTVVDQSLIHCLGTSTTGKQKMFKHRHFVQVCDERTDRAKDIMISLGANVETLEHSDVLYSTQVKDKNHVFFNSYKYDDYFFPSNDCEIEVVEKVQQRSKSPHGSFERRESAKNILLQRHQRRITLLTNTINEIQPKLRKIRDSLKNVNEKIEFCRACCYAEEENSEHLLENISQKSPKNTSDEPGTVAWPMIIDGTLTRDSSMVDSSLMSLVTADFSGLSQTTVSQLSSKQPVSVDKDYLDNICYCDEEMDIDSLAVLEEQQRELQKDEFFYRTLVENLEPKLERHLEAINEPPLNTKRIVIEKLLAWNNEKICKQMVKHSFIHRHSESMVSFPVSNVLSQDRIGFKEAGKHERDCCDFLTMCAHGEPLEIIEYVRRRNVNVNVTDARGNTAVFYAISCCKISSLKTLVNFGANLNAVNDEGLTPLNMSILNYLSLKFKIQDWESAFVPPGIPVKEEEEERFGYQSAVSLPERVRSKKKLFPVCSKAALTKTTVQEYIFDLSCKTFPQPAYTKKSPPVDVDSTRRSLYVDDMIDVHLVGEQTNIEQLLEHGANPNVGEVPFPPLILALFTENDRIVEILLEAEADISMTTEDGLSCLHILANLKCCPENIKICEALLLAHSDPNAKAPVYHWEDQKNKIVGKGVDLADIEDHGKTPLQLLCLRQDYDSDKCNFFEKVADLLIEAKTNLFYEYLGHTPLSLAVLSGNGKLVEHLIRSGFFNPYRLLNYNMGNVLTLFTLKKYEGILPIPKCKELIATLARLHVSPLKTVGDFENAIAFGEFQLLPLTKPAEEQEGGKKKKKSPKKKPPKINKRSQAYIVIQYLKDRARNMIICAAQMQAVECLYDLAEEDLLGAECVKDLVLYLTPEIAVDCLQAVFNYGKIPEDRYSQDCMIKMLEYVDKYKTVVVKRKGAKGKKPKPKKGKVTHEEKPSDISPNYINLLPNIDFRCKYTQTTLRILPPGLDDLTLYDVCFQCLLGKNKELLRCPKCRYVQFCSLTCYNQSVKGKNHKCGVNMFATPEADNPDELRTLCMIAQNNCLQRYIDEKRRELEEKVKKEADERQADIYGTRHLKRRRLVSEASSILNVGRSVIEERSMRSHQRSLGHLESKLTMLTELENEFFTSRRHDTSVNAEPRRRSSSKKKRFADPCERCCEGRLTKPTDMVDTIPVLEEEYRIFKKVKAIPQKMHTFMEVLGRMLPNADFSKTILPYVCYADGQMYYRFNGQNVFAGAYSMV